MTDFIESLKRLYDNNMLKTEQLNRLVNNNKISMEQFNYIIEKGGEE